MFHIVSISGGLGSLEAARRTIETHGKENTRLIFADVKGNGIHSWLQMPTITRLLHERYGGETHDTYRFLWRVSYLLDMPIERLGDNRSIWDVFYKSRALRLVVHGGATFFCPASEELKRRTIARHIQDNYQDGTYKIVLGMGWDEEHRVNRSHVYWRNVLAWDVNVIAPNIEKPYATNASITAWLNDNNIELPSAYREGFEHNNCGKACVQAGQGHFANLYNVAPETYYYWAWMESQLQRLWGKDYTILKDSRGGITKRLTLYDFIPRIIAGDYRALDFSGCGCFTNADTAIAMSKPKPVQLDLFKTA